MVVCTVESFSFLYFDLYVLEDEASISSGYLMLTKHLFVLTHIKNKGEVGIVKNI